MTTALEGFTSSLGSVFGRTVSLWSKATMRDVLKKNLVDGLSSQWTHTIRNTGKF